MLNAVRYFTSERDGADVVPSVFNRQPANLTDQHAYVYASPRYDSNDNLLGKLRRVGGPVNVAGGWFDAGGGYEKFAYTSSYADGLMLLAARDFPGTYPGLAAEAGFGLSWLEKLWNPATKVVYIQDGIGTGNASNTIQGDYNFWFLPQAEDHIERQQGRPSRPHRLLREIPAGVRGGPAGGADQPRLRRAVRRRLRPRRPAGGEAGPGPRPAPAGAGPRRLRHGQDQPRRRDRDRVTRTTSTRAPNGRATCSGAPRRSRSRRRRSARPPARVKADLAVAAHWAKAYLAQGHKAGGDTLNLYDTGAIGEAELLQAMRQPGASQVIAPATAARRPGRPAQAR